MITFSIPRDLWLTSNMRHHRMQVARATKTLRTLGYYRTKQENLQPMEQAHLTVYIHRPSHRRFDLLNGWVTVKALTDGAVDAGLIPDDDSKHLVGPDFRAGEGLCDKQYAAVLDFEWVALVAVAA